MAGEIAYKLTATEKQAVDAICKVAAAYAKTEGGVKKVTESTKKLEREQAEMGRLAKRVYEETRTPMEQHQARMQKISQLRNSGKIDAETYGRAAAASYGRMEASARSTGVAMKTAGDKGTAAFGPQTLSMVRSLAGAMGVGVGLAGAVQLVRSEYTALLETQSRFAESTISVADAEIAALRNLGANTPKERDAFLQEVTEMSGRTGVSEKDLLIRSSEALSARGNLSQKHAMRAVEAGAMLAPESSDVGKALTGAALDVGKITGANPEQALGYLFSVGQKARVTDTGKIAETLAPALTASMASGASARGGGALWASLTQGMADPEGKVSAMATMQLASQLKEFLPEKGVQYSEKEYQRDRESLGNERASIEQEAHRAARQDPTYLEKIEEIELEKATLRGRVKDPKEAAARVMRRRELGEEGRRALEDAKTRHSVDLEAKFALKGQALSDRREASKSIVASGFSTMEERIAHLQSNPEDRKAFLGKATFRERAKVPVEQLLSGHGPTAKAYGEFYESLPAVEESGEMYRRRTAIIRGGSRQRTSGLGRGLAATQESIESARTPEAENAASIGLLRKHAVPILKDIGMSNIATKMNDVGAMLSGDYMGSIRETLVAKKQRLITERPASFEATPMGGFAVPGHKVTEGDKFNASQVQRVIDMIDKANQQQTESAKVIRDAAKDFKDGAAAVRQSNATKTSPCLSAPDRDL